MLEFATPADHILRMRYKKALSGHSKSLKPVISGALETPTPHLDTFPSDPDEFTKEFSQVLDGRKSEQPLPIVSATDKTTALSGLMRTMYPSSMHVFAHPGRISEALALETAADFSFVALGESRGGTTYEAACMAYVADSLVDPGNDVLYLDDLVVMKNAHAAQLGIRMFREFLARAAAHDMPKIELRARRKTSHKAFNGSPGMRRVLVSTGYISTDHGVVATYGEGEDKEYSHLIEIDKV